MQGCVDMSDEFVILHVYERDKEERKILPVIMMLNGWIKMYE